MPKPRRKEEHRCRYFRWLLGLRNKVYFADGRANTPPLGRHSLGTRDRSDALRALTELDLMMAVRHGLASPEVVNAESRQMLSLVEGRRLYGQYVQRPAVANGPKASTAKRYRPILDKFLAHCQANSIQTWNEVNRRVFDAYAAWLDAEEYAYATEYIELTTLKQVLKFLVQEEHLPATAIFSYPMRKPTGTDTYCYTTAEVAAMLEHCTCPELLWLRSLLLALARTGMRISELAGLRWTDVDFVREIITLSDESRGRSRSQADRRTLKSGYSRSFPIHAELLEVLSTMERHRDGRVFHGPLGGKIKPDKIRRALVRDVLTPLAERFPNESGQVGFLDGRLHSFRHFFCSECANAGIPERVLMQWLGHRSSKMVHHYYHLHDDESRRQMARLKPVGKSGNEPIPDLIRPASA